jgi:hypothetical protein
MLHLPLLHEQTIKNTHTPPYSKLTASSSHLFKVTIAILHSTVHSVVMDKLGFSVNFLLLVIFIRQKEKKIPEKGY